jgi:nucleoside 2-deoxyribosyltransferase
VNARLERPEQSTAWELCTAWAKGRPVVLTLSDRCMVQRIEGVVSRVAVTGAFVVIEGWHVPTVEILSIASPHYSQKNVIAEASR